MDDPTGSQPFNPFTETPVQGVNWDYGTKFGKPTDADRVHAAADVQVLGGNQVLEVQSYEFTDS